MDLEGNAGTMMSNGIEKNTGFLELDIMLLYHQGFWTDESDGVYERFYSPWLVRLIVRHNYIRTAINFQRYIYPRFLMFSIVFHVFLLHPITILKYKNDFEVIVESLYFIGLFTIMIATIAAVFLNTEKLKRLHRDIVEISKMEDEEEMQEVKTLRKIFKFNHIIVFYSHSLYIGMILGCMVVYGVMYAFPYRCLYIRAWYPYEVESQPYFVMTFMYESIYLFSATFSCTSMGLFFSIIQYTLGVHYNILCGKLRNLRSHVAKKLRAKCVNLSKASIQPLIRISNERHDKNRLNRHRSVHISTERRKMFISKLNKQKHMAATLRQPHRSRVESLKFNLDNSDLGVEYCEDVDRVSDCYKVGNRHISHSTVNVGRQNVNFESKVSGQKAGKTPLKADGEAGVVGGITGSVNAEQVDKEMLVELSKLVDAHNILLRLSTELTSTVKACAIALVVCYVGGAGITMVLVRNAVVITIKEIMFIFVFIVIGCGTFILQLSSTWVISLSEEVGLAMYESDWLESSKSFKKAMLVVMSRANVPVVFKPPGLGGLSLGRFGELSIQAYKVLTSLMQIFK